MKEFMKRSGALLLCLCMLAGCAANNPEAPAEEAENAGETAAPSAAEEVVVEEEPELKEPIEEALNFEGKDFTILCSQSSMQHVNININELTGDALNDAIYNRSRLVEDKLNVHMTDDNVINDSGVCATTFQTSVTAGDEAFQYAMILERKAPSMAQMGLMTDIATLPYVDLSQPWYNQDINNSINFTNNSYLVYGDSNLSQYDWMHALLFNVQMIEDLGLEKPFDLVLSGGWTIDKWAEMGRAAIMDLDGDGEWTDKDSFAFIGGCNTAIVDFLASSQVRSISVDEQKNVTVNLESDPRIEEIFTKVSDILWETGFWTHSGNSNDYWKTQTHFQTNQALFADFTLYTIHILRDMETDFGIIPFPKMYEEQEGYGSMIEAGSRAGCIPSTIADPNMVGAVFEMLNFYSFRDVVPVYYEIVLKQKYSRDPVSTQMLDIITHSVCYDVGDTLFNDDIKDGFYSSMLSTNARKFASLAKSKVKALEKKIEKMQTVQE